MPLQKKILVVDDEVEILEIYSQALKAEGYLVTRSGDGVDALFKMQNEKFDLIVTDLTMPRLSGDRMIEDLALKRNPHSHRPVIFSSGFVDHKLIDKFKTRPNVRFLTKPTDIKVLIKEVQNLLSASPVRTSAVDVRVINPVIEGAMKIVSGAFGAGLKVGKPFLRQEVDISGDISAIVGLVSDGFRGNIALSFVEASYLKLVSRQFGAELKVLDADARDVIGEIIKMIFDLAKEKFLKDSLSVQMTTPSVITGKGHSVSHHSNSSPMVILFENDKNEGFRIEISSITGV